MSCSAALACMAESHACMGTLLADRSTASLPPTSVQPPFPPRPCFPPSLQGLEYLHSIHIVHGNLNPLNVLFKTSHLDRRGFTVRLGDFGYSTVHGLGE